VQRISEALKEKAEMWRRTTKVQVGRRAILETVEDVEKEDCKRGWSEEDKSKIGVGV
jgi:hypothetical protein